MWLLQSIISKLERRLARLETHLSEEDNNYNEEDDEPAKHKYTLSACRDCSDIGSCYCGGNCPCHYTSTPVGIYRDKDEDNNGPEEEDEVSELTEND